ncbi:MAG: malonyl-CoA synthase [Proteobacteria bacterium]|nr:malonyl-CoA synthase [Pseudomonadota bacterium]
MRNNLFDTLFNGQPEHEPCLQLADDSIINYGELLLESARVANALVALGVQPGDRVAAQVDKNVAAVALYLGTIRAGAVFLPLNTAYTASEVEYFVNDARPALFIGTTEAKDSLLPMVQHAKSRLETLSPDGAGGSWPERLREAETEFSTIAREADDLAAILYTSGTTGRAKGAMITHDNLASNAKMLASLWGFHKDDILLHALPIYHTHGLFVAINTVMIAGASMRFLPGFDAKQVLQMLPVCTVMMGVPTYYSRLLALDEFNARLVTKMRLFISGSAPMTLDTHKAFSERTGMTILERYGMTETNMITSNPCDGERVPGSVGFPLPGVEIRITNSNTGQVCELPSENIGMIEVRGPNVFKGYWRMPEKTAEEFRDDGFFITGDLGMIDDRGYLHIVGRDKDMIISGGYNVYPKEIEIPIDKLDGVVESAVIGLPHKDFGEAVIAVVARQEDSAIDEAGIIAALSIELAKYKIPKRIFFVDELPRNAMGKIQKNILRDNYGRIY